MNDENFKTEGECPLHGWMMASGIMRWDALIFTHCIWAGLMGCPTNRMHQKKWCSSSEPEPQESLAVSACSSMLLPPPGECVQLIFYSIKKNRLRTKSPQSASFWLANSSWSPDIQGAQSKPEETNLLSMAVGGSTLDGLLYSAVHAPVKLCSHTGWPWWWF